jgi:hypothetical protein
MRSVISHQYPGTVAAFSRYPSTEIGETTYEDARNSVNDHRNPGDWGPNDG